MRFVIRSDVGKKRSVNEDRAEVYKHSDEVTLAVIADGMGGHNAGDVASSILVEQLADSFKAVVSEPDFRNREFRKEWLHEAVLEINQHIYQSAIENPSCKGMGTTLDATLLYNDYCLICHVGDSRVYLISDGSIEQVTKDHSYVNALVESGEISQEQAEHHPQKNLILKAIGSEKAITPDFIEFPVDEHSVLLLCSDGLSNKLSGNEILTVLEKAENLEAAGDELIRQANDRGGEDNISLIIMSEMSGEVQQDVDR
ncbi:Stp1/IreP family PP2C-type Ser/Thr phosphatase [Chungangia koreensis]|uniref:Stp1/IreP family PP2C-type Ser/Thr phosphatase n=1 Tax=Chungangia koreensis TaxID=752657 RepID=A0ABV8X018_9LACT